MKKQLTEAEKQELARLEALEKKRNDLKVRSKFQQKHEEAQRRRKEKEERRRNTSILIGSTQYAVPIRDIYKGVVVTTDGRFIKIMEFMPQNFQMLSAQERNRIASGFGGIFSNTQYKMQFKTLSTKADTDSLIDVMKKHREDETDPKKQIMQDEYIQLIRDTALSQGVSRRFFIIIEFSRSVDNDGTNIDSIVGSLNATAVEIKTMMNNIGNAPIAAIEKPATLQELFWKILNRRTAEEEPFATRVSKVLSIYDARDDIPENRKRNIPATDMVAPAWIDFTHPRYVVVCGTKGDNINPKTGKQNLKNKYYTFAYLSKDTYPVHVSAGWMDIFTNISEGIDCDIFIEPVPREKVEEKIGLQIRMQRAKVDDSSDTNSDYNRTLNTIDSGLFILDALSAGEKFFYVSVLLTITGDTRQDMETRYKSLKREIKSQLGADIVRPDYQMESAFRSALPLCKLNKNIARKAKHNILTGGMSTMYPFLTYEMQDPNGIMVGINSNNNSLVAIDVFDTKQHANANGVILGETGFGKTYTANLIAARMCLQGVQTFILTPIKGKVDYGRIVEALNGQYICLRPGTQNHINIFDIAVPDNVEDDNEQAASWLDTKVKSLHTFFALAIKSLTPEEDSLLDRYIYEAYARRGITQINESVFIPGTKTRKEMPLLGDVYALLKDSPDMRRVANILTPMINGSMSTYNKPTNVDLSNKFIVVDLDGAEKDDVSIPMFIALDYIWGRIRENKLDRKLFMIDEASKLISSEQNELAAEYMRSIFKLIRAYGGSAFAMTQDVADFFALKDGAYGRAIINNANTKILLHLNKTNCDQISGCVSLTPKEVDAIGKLQRGKGIVVAGNAKLFVDFKSSEYEHQILTTDVNDLKKQQKKLKEQNQSENQPEQNQQEGGAAE